jgi:hypothetical protein
MLPTTEVIYFIEKSRLVHNKIENVKCAKSPCLTVNKKFFISKKNREISNTDKNEIWNQNYVSKNELFILN